jgi:hypothetical protein
MDKSSQRIPVELRSLTFLAMGRGWGRHVGIAIYEMAISRCVIAFKKFAPDIRLIRGSVSRCVPGISDIDILILSKNRDPSLWPAIKNTYLSLKRQYPMLGGLQLTDFASFRRLMDSPSGSRLWYNEQRCYGTQTSERVQLDFDIQPQRRFAVGLFHFVKAQCYYHLLSSSSVLQAPFHRASFEREVRKSLASLKNKERLSEESPLEQLLWLSKILDQYATNVPDTSNRQQRLTAKLIKKRSGFFYSVQKLQHFDYSIQNSILLTPSMWHLYLSGWCWDELGATLNELAASHARFVPNSWFQALKDRFLTLQISLLVDFFSPHQREFRSQVRSLCRIAMMLKSGLVTNVDSWLEERSKSLPNTLHCFRTCATDAPPSADIVAAALDEMEEIAQVSARFFPKVKPQQIQAKF